MMDNGRLINTLISGDSHIVSQGKDWTWWQSLVSHIPATYGAYNSWTAFMNYCVDCPPGETDCYGAWTCVWSALTTVWSTAGVFFKWGELVAVIAKRENSDGWYIHLSSHGPMSLFYDPSLTQYAKRDDSHSIVNMTVQIDNVNVYTMNTNWTEVSIQLVLNHRPDMLECGAKMSPSGKRHYTDYGKAYSVDGGLKYNYCAVHPEHVLTEQYDWDSMWAAAASNGPNLANYYYSDVAVVEMNDYAQGGRRTLIGTGKLVEEQSNSFGDEFEDCDADAFSQLAR